MAQLEQVIMSPKNSPDSLYAQGNIKTAEPTIVFQILNTVTKDD